MRAQDPFFQAEAVPLVCAECGATVLLAPAEAQRRRFCGRECLHMAQRRNMLAGTHPLPPGHTSEAGRQRSLANLKMGPAASKEQRAMAAPVWVVCTVCDTEFPTRATPVPRFCSEKCRKQDERARGLYRLLKKCCVCGIIFETSAYKTAQTCSKSCARTFGHQQKKSRATARKETELCP